ncbi:hypothetical protein Tco_1159555, partial [Tanacetum coccineum]
MSAKSKILNNVRYITAKVAGKPMADGIDSLHNHAIFDAIQLMGSKSTSWDQIPTNIATAVICLATNQKYNFCKIIVDGMMRHLDAKKKCVMYPRFILVFLTNQLKNVSVPLDHFPINALTTKVFSFMVKKGKSFSGNVTPLFPSMLAQPTEDEDQHEAQPDPSPRPSPTIPIPDSIPEGFGGNHEDLKSQIKQLKKKAKPVISHHNAWIKSVSIKKRLARKKSLKKKQMLTWIIWRPRATSTRLVLTLKPLPKIDPKDKGKKVLEEESESDAESKGVDKAERKYDQLAKDEEIARKVQENWEAKEE